MRRLRKLLIIRTDRMGDLLMSVPAIRAVRKGMPGAQIHLLMQKELRPLLENHPDIDRLHSFEPGGDRGLPRLLRTALWMRRERFDAVLVMNPSKFFHTASFLAGVPVRAGYRRKLGFLLNRSLPDTKAERNLHESEYNLELARLLEIPATAESLEIPVSPDGARAAARLLAWSGIPTGEKPVAIHPWTSNPAKGWPPERFWEAARRLQQSGRTVVLIGLPPPGNSVPLPAAGAIDLSGRTPLELLPALLKGCRLLLSNDSGPAHVAAAVGTPTVVVAAKEHERQLSRWRPLGPAHRTLIDPSVEEVIRACAS